jgi:vesicle-fusing ATPase
MDGMSVDMRHFVQGVAEITPAFGVQEDELGVCFSNHGIVDFGSNYQTKRAALDRLVTQGLTSDQTPLLTVLLKGPQGAGKTALAAQVASTSKFDLVKLVSASELIGKSEMAKCAHLQRVFDDAYKSPRSMVVIDDLERIIDYVPVGPRFSNVVLQALLVRRRIMCDTASHYSRYTHHLYTFIAAYAPMHLCAPVKHVRATTYTPNTPLNTLYTPYIHPKYTATSS